MVKRLAPKTIVALWFVLVAAVSGVLAMAGVRTSEATAWLLTGLALVPPAIVRFVWRDSAPTTVAELLHDVEQGS